MRQDDVLIKWTGSKRLQAPQILKFFPEYIETYYEPFLGGGSMLYLLMSSNKAKRIQCSDINSCLIEVWQMIKDDPGQLFDFYSSLWPYDQEKYYRLREEFNSNQDPKKFFCLLRTCRNGLVRFNKSGEFTSAFHLRRKGIKPVKLEPVVHDWSDKLNLHNVCFSAKDYRDIQSKEGDFVYLDPPYATTVKFYHGMIDFLAFWNWLEDQSGGYAISLNIKVPKHLYDEELSISGGFHRFNRLDKVNVHHSLYVKRGPKS